jgi:membrane protease YdiL (CAAX protease family)
VFGVQAYRGQFRSRLAAGAPHGAVYAETFALWLVLYPGLTLAASLSPWAEDRLYVGTAAFLLSLAALGWPVVRGIPWRQVLQEIGWTRGRGVLREIGWGLAAYVSTLPLLFLALLFILFLMTVMSAFGGDGAAHEMSPADAPSHPLVEWLTEAGFWGRLHLLFLACVCAPVVEETMFRGVLYRQLRDASAHWRTGASVLWSAVVNSFIFAVIHPQGFIAVPALMTLAAGFSLVREWRGSLLAPMTAHGINNFVVTLMLLLLL